MQRVKSLRIVAVLAVGAMVASASACSSAGPVTTGLTRQWSSQAADGADPGTWLTGGMLVDGTDSGLTARNLRTGHTEWSWKPPAAPSGWYSSAVMTSGASMSTSGGVGVVDYLYDPDSGNARTSEYQAGIDLADGHTLWTLNASYLPGPVTGAGVVASLYGHGNSPDTYVAAASLATGKPAWSTASDQVLKGCAFPGLAISGALVYGLAACGGSSAFGDSPTYILYGLSARTGVVESKVTLDEPSCTSTPASYGSPALFAVSGYLIVSCPGSESAEQAQLVVLHAGSSRQAVVTYSIPAAALAYPPAGFIDVPIFITGTMLYFATPSGVVAISLTTDKLLWQKDTSGSLVGADRSGALIVGTSSGGGDNSSQVSLWTASMSARSGTVSYGPGTTFDGEPDGYDLFFTGHTLIADSTGNGNSPGVVAYGTGSWPG
jgi:hypothetical protein